jgi:hypothetical protein
MYLYQLTVLGIFNIHIACQNFGIFTVIYNDAFPQEILIRLKGNSFLSVDGFLMWDQE